MVEPTNTVQPEGIEAEISREEAAMTAPPSNTSRIIAQATPELLEGDSVAHRRLVEALVACRAGKGASSEARLAAAFDLYAADLLTRGDIRTLFNLDLWQFTELQDRHLT
jgi:hypothetical protein